MEDAQNSKTLICPAPRLSTDDGCSHDDYTSHLKDMKGDELHKLTEKVLKQELARWNVPYDKSDDKQDLLAKVRRVHGWMAMDQASLRKECLMMNKMIPGDVSIQDVIQLIFRTNVPLGTAANNFATAAARAPATTPATAAHLPVLETQSRAAGAPTSTGEPLTTIEEEMDTPVSSNICGIYTVVSAGEPIGRVKLVALSPGCDFDSVQAFHFIGASEEISGSTVLKLPWDTNQVEGLDIGKGQCQRSPGTGSSECGALTIRWPDDSIWIKSREITLDDLRARNCGRV